MVLHRQHSVALATVLRLHQLNRMQARNLLLSTLVVLDIQRRAALAILLIQEDPPRQQSSAQAKFLRLHLLHPLRALNLVPCIQVVLDTQHQVELAILHIPPVRALPVRSVEPV